MRLALALSLSLLAAQPAQAQFWQCAPFARMISGINIFGNAGTWWSQAAGKFARGHLPKPGAVMAFMNAGGVRSPGFVAPTGASYPYAVTYGDAFTVQPFGNPGRGGRAEGAVSIKDQPRLRARFHARQPTCRFPQKPCR